MVLALALSLGLAAAPPNPFLAKAAAQIEDLDELGALKTLEEAKRVAGSDPSQQAQVSLLSGLAHAGLSQEPEAIAAFQQALALDPTLSLPPGSSPRVEGWWNRAKPPPPATVLTPTQASEPLVMAAATPVAPQRPRLARWVGIGALGVAAVLSGVAVVNGLGASSQLHLAQQAEGVVEAQTLERQAVQQALRANLFYGLGATFAVGGVVTLLFD